MMKNKTKKKHAQVNSCNPPIEWEGCDEVRLQPTKGKHFSRLMQLDEYVLSSPIASTSERRTECPHFHSSMRSAEPNMFIKFPYRASLMTLLRHVSSVPSDTVASAHLSSDPPLIYAGFQNHWNTVIDTPVLSIVGACNTNISPPIVTRSTYEYANVKIMASTSLEQHVVEFKVPLIQFLDTAANRIVVETVSALDIDDHLTTYVIHAQNPREPMVMIKLWNLSTYGCGKLHLQSVYEVPRVDITDELHILGLSGDRNTSYQVTYPYIRDSTMSMLEELDLQAIGYRAKRESKPHLSTSSYDRMPSRTDINLMARMTPQKSTYRYPSDIMKIIVVPKRTVHYEGKIPIKPFFYPQAIKHKAGTPYGIIKPVLFPAGFQTYRNLTADKLITLKDICFDMAFNGGTDCMDYGIREFSRQCFISQELIQNNLLMPFNEFFKKHMGKTYQRTNMPYFIRPPAKEIMPTDWIHSTKHPAVSDRMKQVRLINEGDEIDFPVNADDAIQEITITPEDGLDIDGLPTEIIDTNFWFNDDDVIPDDATTIPETKPLDAPQATKADIVLQTAEPEPSPRYKTKRLRKSISKDPAVRVETPPDANDLPEAIKLMIANIKMATEAQKKAEKPVDDQSPTFEPPNEEMMKKIQKTAMETMIKADKDIIKCMKMKLEQNK
jgi:hypothetical protein